MSFLLFQLKRFVLFPFEFFSSPDGFIGASWREAGRGRALLLGLPAVVLAVVGVALLVWAEFGMSASLEDHYKAKAEKSAAEKNRLADDLRQELSMVRATNLDEANSGQKSADELIPKDDPRRVEYEQWLDEEEVFRQKLIDLNEQEPEYKYQLAIVSMEQGKLSRGLSLMNITAPLDEPGYIKGHLWLAKFHWKNARAANSLDQIETHAKLALQHLDQSLKRDQSNLEAKQLKASMLLSIGDLRNAYAICEDLFKDDVMVFSQMLEINERLNRESLNILILEDAISRLEKKLNDEELKEEQWQVTLSELTRCYRRTKDFAAIEQLLLKEIETQSVKSANSPKLVFLKKLLATVYLGWANSIRGNNEIAQQFEYLKKAFTLDETNPYVLLELTKMGAEPTPPDVGRELNSDEALQQMAEDNRIYEEKMQIAASAKLIYDPSNLKDLNSLVLNELGSQALGLKQYEKAISYFEAARQRSPKSPDILNNLSYTYLVCDEPNPNRALKLVDQALRFFRPTTLEARKLRSHFHDTRGLAMMQLNRLDEAAADFEIALSERPDNEKILNNLVDCYRLNGLDPSGWQERLDEIRTRQSAGGNQTP